MLVPSNGYHVKYLAEKPRLLQGDEETWKHGTWNKPRPAASRNPQHKFLCKFCLCVFAGGLR